MDGGVRGDGLAGQIPSSGRRLESANESVGWLGVRGFHLKCLETAFGAYFSAQSRGTGDVFRSRNKTPGFVVILSHGYAGIDSWVELQDRRAQCFGSTSSPRGRSALATRLTAQSKADCLPIWVGQRLEGNMVYGGS
jgi:hypothetical protein